MDVGSVNLSSSQNNALEGLKKATNQVNQAAQNIAGGSQDPQDVVSLSQGASSFKANAAVLNATDQVTQSLLDIKA